MKEPLIAIIDTDRLRAAGLRHLIHLHLDRAEVTIADSPASLSAEPALIFATPQAIAANTAYFFTRRDAIVVLSETKAADFTTLDPTAPEDIIIEQLGPLLSAASAPRTPVNLSPREIEVLRLLATGHISKEIADRLSISVNTVLSHRKNITAKLGIRSISGLGIYAVINGLISDRDL